MTKISKVEITRKLIHLSSVVYPLLYITLEKKTILIAIGSILYILLLTDILRKHNNKINNIFCKYFGFTIRKTEYHGFTGSTYFMIGTFLSILLFSQKIAILSLFVLVISDTCASIIGISYGKKKIIEGKTFEGFLAFLVSAFLVSLFGSFYFHLPVLFPYYCIFRCITFRTF